MIDDLKFFFIVRSFCVGVIIKITIGKFSNLKKKIIFQQSWEALPPDTATFTPDITPLILAAHRDNYEIIKILLDRGATLPDPHHVRYRIGCGVREKTISGTKKKILI